MNSNPRPHDDELISAYLDGELSGAEQERVETLLKDNDETRQRYDELCALSESLQSLETHKLDADFHLRVLQRVHDFSPSADADEVTTAASGKVSTAKRFNSRSLVWPVAAIAATVLIVLTVPIWKLRIRPVAQHEITVDHEAAVAKPAVTESLPFETNAELAESVEDSAIDSLGDVTDGFGSGIGGREYDLSPKPGISPLKDADAELSADSPVQTPPAPTSLSRKRKKTAAEPKSEDERFTEPATHAAEPNTAPESVEKSPAYKRAGRYMYSEATPAPVARQPIENQSQDVRQQLANTEYVVGLYVETDEPTGSALDAAMLKNNIDYDDTVPVDTPALQQQVTRAYGEASAKPQSLNEPTTGRGGARGSGTDLPQESQPRVETQMVLVEAPPQDILATIADLQGNQSVRLVFRQLDRNPRGLGTNEKFFFDGAEQQGVQEVEGISQEIDAAEFGRQLNRRGGQQGVEANLQRVEEENTAPTDRPDSYGRSRVDRPSEELETRRVRERHVPESDAVQSQDDVSDVAQRAEPDVTRQWAGGAQFGIAGGVPSRRGRAVRLSVGQLPKPDDNDVSSSYRQNWMAPDAGASRIQEGRDVRVSDAVLPAQDRTSTTGQAEELAGIANTLRQSNLGYSGQNGEWQLPVRVLFVVQTAPVPASAEAAPAAGSAAEGESVEP